MESQLPRSYGHHYEQGSHIQPAEEDEHHHDKKSVLGKVKEKAKRIKNTLKIHGHGHDHDHAHDHSHDEDDENDQGEEIVQDPQIHGAPIYDSATVASIRTPRTAEFDSGLHKGNLEKPSVMKEDRYELMFGKPPERTFAQWEAEDEKSRDKPDEQHVSFPDLTASAGVPRENLGIRGVTMEEDTNAPGKDRIFGDPSKYETKVTDSTGREKETGVAPILHSLDKMGIYSEQGQSSPGMYDEIHNILGTKQNLGTRDQFSPTLDYEQRNKPIQGTNNQFSTAIYDEPRNKQNIGANQSLGSTTGSHDQFSPVIHGKPGNKPNLQTNQNLGSTTGSNDQSLPGVYDEPRNSPDLGAIHSHDQHSPGIYDEPRTDCHIGTKQSFGETTGSRGRFHPETRSTNDFTRKSPDQSSYTGMISSAASSVADKAISAKDAVASTLGYGGPVTGKNTSHSAQGGGLAAKVTEAGSAVMSKVSPSDSSGASVKEYWIENLKPGEEDKALSEVISGAISANPAGEEDIDKRAPDETKMTTTSARGRVTESKDLALRLGLEGDKDVGEGVGVGKGMVDVIRGTVNSWIRNENSQGNAAEDDDCTVKDHQQN